MKKLMFISILILLLISISAVSASDNLNQNITETNDVDNQIDINNDDILSASSARTFTDLQSQISKTGAGETLTLYDDYEYTEGTDRTIGIAIYSTTKDITIDGNGHTLDGKNTARILYVNEGATNIVVKNLNLINGYQESGAGAIFWKGESGTIDNCNFTSNTADKSGGAILWSAAKGTITNCNFEKSASKSQSGGAIYVNDQATQLTITNNKFTSNTAKTSAAGIGSAGANTIISNNIFTDNQAHDSGAALYISGANSKVNNNQFIRNQVVGSGGAIFWKGENGVIDSCNFTSNIAEGSGGAVIWTTEKGTITNCIFEKSISKTLSGGAIYCNEQSKQTTISNNKFINNSAQTCGAGIGSAAANSIIANNIFTDNWAYESGAALYTSGVNSKINNNQFIRNKVDGSGGAIYIEINEISMDRCTFIDNYAPGGGGGAMRWNGNSGTMTNCRFTDNNAVTRGGAIYWNGDNAKIENNNFTQNKANTAAGGALLYWGNNGQITSNNFEDNIAVAGYGGALYVDGNSNTISGNNFNKNTAARGGGAIYYNGTSGTVSGNTITDNTAENACGIRWAGASATITGNTFKGNTNTNGQNIIYGDGTKASVTKNTFINNKETDNCIRWNSADAVIKDNIYQEQPKTTSLTLDDVTLYYGETGKIIATLRDSDSKAVGGKSISITFNNKQTSANTDAKGQVIMDIKNLNVGTYPVSAKFEGDSQYDPSNATATVTINKAPTKTTLSFDKEIYAREDIILTATVNATNGNVTFIVGPNGESRTVKLVDGKATLLIPSGFIMGEYPVTAKYNGERNYLTSSAKDKLIVIMGPTSIITSDVVMYVGGKGEAVFTLVDYNNTAMKNETIIITSDDKELTLITDDGGKVKFELEGLELGTYQVTAFYSGYDKVYLNSTATAKVSVLPTIESKDLVANYGNATYTAKFIDTTGKALAKGTYVSFTIDNDAYRVTVDGKGIATLNIDKTPGKYVITNINTVTGDTTTNKITINKMPTETIISGIKDIYVGENLTGVKINVNVNTSGELIITLENNTQKVNYTGEEYDIDFNNMPEGEYTVIATFEPESKYYIGSSTNATFKVSKRANELTVNTKDIEEGQDAVFDVATTMQTGNVTLNIGNKSYTQKLSNGKATFTVSNLTADTYNYTVSVPGDDYYESNSTTGSIKVKSTTLIINAPGLEKYFSSPEKFTFTVIDKDGNPLENILIYVTINGVTYNKTTDSKGFVGMNIGLPANNYTALLSFKGNDNYSPVNTTSSIIVKTTVYGSDVTKVEKAPGPYTATFLDANGKKLTSNQAIFNINGVFYFRDIDNGVARLNLNLEAGKYIITAYNPVTGEQSSNIITINSRFANNHDVTKYYRNNTQYHITIIGDDGKPVGAGETVTLNINGVMYERQTNENGTATLNINLNPGNYVITAMYKGCRVSNNIQILPIIIADNIEMRYKDGTQFKAKLVDGQGNPYAEQYITFNINGVFYNRKTGNDGIAKLNINLMPGIYIITSYYGTFATSNEIKINP